MNVTVEIDVLGDTAKPCIKVHNAWADGRSVELEINGERYKVNAEEMISAIKRCEMGYFSGY